MGWSRALCAITLLAWAAVLACTSNPPILKQDAGDVDADTDLEADADTDTDTDADTDTGTGTGSNACDHEIDWADIAGGNFMMGGPEGTVQDTRLPMHEVTVPSFEMTRTEITAAQYRCCYLDGACGEPQPDGYVPDDGPFEYDDLSNCNWDLPEEDDRPINCVSWQQAVEFCEWAGGRLPSEAEWEYAARGQGQDVTYPWGEAGPTCEHAIMWEHGGTEYACDAGTTWPVCSRPAGNTEQGLCDMAGSVAEMVQDCYHYGYEGAPSTADPWSEDCEMAEHESRVIRGGDFSVYQTVFLRTQERDYTLADYWFAWIGFRCAR